MKWHLWVFLMIIAALAYSMSAKSDVNSDMQELFGDNEEIEVIVVLKDDYNVINEYGFAASSWDDNERKKMMISHQQEHILDELNLKDSEGLVLSNLKEEYDFELTNIYSNVNGFAGKLKKSSYQKLINNTNSLP